MTDETDRRPTAAQGAPNASARRAASFLSAMLVGLLALSWAGCAPDADGSPDADGGQDLAVVPSDPQVVRDRADQARVKGAEDAPVRIVEISDFQCPFCRQYYDQTMGVLDSLYVQTGKVRYVWIAYANPGHPRAWPSIEAAFCAGAVGKFWPMHDLLFERQEEWSSADDAFAMFVDYAKGMGIDPESFGACMRDDLLAPFLLGDYTNVMRAGISSTPYFILADSVAIRGAAPIETFRSAIDTLLVLKDDSGEQAEEGRE
jgi:protein-disulfide isomerase